MVGDGQCGKLFVYGDRRSAVGMWGYTPVRTTGVLVCLSFCLLSPHADRHVGDISFTVCLFVFLFVCLFVRSNFGNGYLGRGLA